jgi:hypothetical protein
MIRATSAWPFSLGWTRSANSNSLSRAAEDRADIDENDTAVGTGDFSTCPTRYVATNPREAAV